MTEGMGEQFSDYKAFASAAKEVGFDKVERKLAAMDPEFIVEGTSEELRRQVSPEMLVSFFQTLRENPETKTSHLLKIGNFLYQHRSDRRGDEVVGSLNEKDIRLIDLGSALLEDAFYDGKLEKLDNERAALIAFTSNVFAKLQEQPVGQSLKGFDKERMKTFVGEVVAFEVKNIFPDALAEDPRPPREQQVLKYKADAEAALARAKSIETTTQWPEYFGKQISEMQDALDVLVEAGKLTQFGASDIYQIINLFEANQRLLFNAYKVDAIELAKNAANGSVVDTNRDYYLRMSVSEYMQQEFGRGSKRGGDRGKDPYIFLNTSASYKTLKESLAKTPKETASKPRVLTDFDQLAKVKSLERVPEAVAALGFLFEKKPPGPLGNYIEELRMTSKLIRRKDLAVEYDIPFSNSLRNFSSRLDRTSAVPYFIKTYLIVNGMLGAHDRSDNYTAYQLSTEKQPYDWVKRRQFNPSYDFLKSNPTLIEGVGIEYDRGPAYADMHFIPEDVPFTVWASKYLRSKRESEAS